MIARNHDRLQCIVIGLQLGRAGLEAVGVDDEGDHVDILLVRQAARLALGHGGRDAGEQLGHIMVQPMGQPFVARQLRHRLLAAQIGLVAHRAILIIDRLAALGLIGGENAIARGFAGRRRIGGEGAVRRETDTQDRREYRNCRLSHDHTD